jgi:hypothetical protein
MVTAFLARCEERNLSAAQLTQAVKSACALFPELADEFVGADPALRVKEAALRCAANPAHRVNDAACSSKATQVNLAPQVKEAAEIDNANPAHRVNDAASVEEENLAPRVKEAAHVGRINPSHRVKDAERQSATKTAGAGMLAIPAATTIGGGLIGEAVGRYRGERGGATRGALAGLGLGIGAVGGHKGVKKLSKGGHLDMPLGHGDKVMHQNAALLGGGLLGGLGGHVGLQVGKEVTASFILPEGLLTKPSLGLKRADASIAKEAWVGPTIAAATRILPALAKAPIVRPLLNWGGKALTGIASKVPSLFGGRVSGAVAEAGTAMQRPAQQVAQQAANQARRAGMDVQHIMNRVPGTARADASAALGRFGGRTQAMDAINATPNKNVGEAFVHHNAIHGQPTPFWSSGGMGGQLGVLGGLTGASMVLPMALPGGGLYGGEQPPQPQSFEHQAFHIEPLLGKVKGAATAPKRPMKAKSPILKSKPFSPPPAEAETLMMPKSKVRPPSPSPFELDYPTAALPGQQTMLAGRGGPAQATMPGLADTAVSPKPQSAIPIAQPVSMLSRAPGFAMAGLGGAGLGVGGMMAANALTKKPEPTWRERLFGKVAKAPSKAMVHHPRHVSPKVKVIPGERYYDPTASRNYIANVTGPGDAAYMAGLSTLANAAGGKQNDTENPKRGAREGALRGLYKGVIAGGGAFLGGRTGRAFHDVGRLSYLRKNLGLHARPVAELGGAVLGAGLGYGGGSLTQKRVFGPTSYEQPSTLNKLKHWAGAAVKMSGVLDDFTNHWHGLEPKHKAMAIGGGTAALLAALNQTRPESSTALNLGVGVGGLGTAAYGLSGGQPGRIMPAIQNALRPKGPVERTANRFVDTSGHPNIQALIRASDQEIKPVISQLTPERRRAFLKQVQEYQPSMFQRAGAAASGIDIEGQRSRFGRLLGS